MKRFYLCILTLGIALVAFAVDDRAEKINAIKKDSCYVYGEATMATQEEAMLVAYERLQDEVNSWAQMDSIKIMDFIHLSDTIITRRAEMYRVFAYVEKPKLKHIVDSISAHNASHIAKKDSMLMTDSVRMIIDKRFFGKEGKMKQRTNDALLRIKKAKNFFELKAIMQPLKEKGDIIDYGKYVTATHPETCYLIVYDPAGNICALLGKGKDVRQNLKTGKDDSIQNYRGCGAIWFTIRE